MGNSGSAHSAVPNLDDHNNYRHSPSQWSQSIPRDTTNRHTHQIKVLPELKAGPRLRPTNNGNILHGGGTLSGRRDLILHNGVFRTRSTSSTRSSDPVEQQNVSRVPHPHQLMQRSQTQLNIIRKQSGLSTLPETNQMKRFGSEPDLRGSGDERQDAQKANMDKSNLPKAKLIRNKKKKAAPLPPVQVKANQATMERKSVNYDPSRFGWKKLDDKPPMINKENGEDKETPKKLRLFKTKAETQKVVNEVTVIPKEIQKQSSAKNHLSRQANVDRQSFNSLPHYHDARNAEFDRLSDHREETVPALPLFRREKSFDLSLLMQQKQSNFGNDLFANRQSQPKPPNNNTNQLSIPVGRMSSVESKLRSRKFSHQPVIPSTSTTANNTETDFKKELLAATRRRSQNIVLKTKEEPIVHEQKLPTKSFDELDNILGSKTFERSEKKPIDDYEDRRSVRKYSVKEDSEERHQQQPVNETATKTFYFGMTNDQSMLLNEESTGLHKSTRDLLSPANRFSELDSVSSDSSLSSALIDHFPMHLIQTIDEHLNDPDSNPSGIQLHVRPTLPRRQYEVPRFSPAAAWKNLAINDCDIAASPDEMTNVCEKQNFSSYSANDINEPTLNQQLLENRIERVYRDPIPGFLDNKSGDSGISGDAGMLQERVESPTARDCQNNDNKIGPFLMPWTPLQDLGEESSSDEAEMANSKEELTKLVNRGHVFSLSLPRESHLLGYGGDNLQLADVKTFNSLQKLKRTVSSAFGGSNDSREQNKPPIYHNENWMLSRSAPNSIDNNLFSPALNAPSECGDDNEDFVAYEDDRNEQIDGIEDTVQSIEYRSYNRRPRQQTQTEHSKILPPSFNYLTGGKHLMYLPNQDSGSGYDETDTVGNDRRYAVDVKPIENKSSKYVVAEQEPNERENLQDPPEFALNLIVNVRVSFVRIIEYQNSLELLVHFRVIINRMALNHHKMLSKLKATTPINHAIIIASHSKVQSDRSNEDD